MAWSNLPATADTQILAAALNELRSAINERNTVSGAGATLPDTVTTDGDQPEAWLTAARTAVEAIIPYYSDPDNDYQPYTKATCLTAAIGQNDWTAVGNPKDMQIANINEMKSVIDKLLWVRLTASRLLISSLQTVGYDNNYNTSWGEASTAYASGSFTESSGTNPIVGIGDFTGKAYYDTGEVLGDYVTQIRDYRIKEMDFTVPTGTYTSTKFSAYFTNKTLANGVEAEVATGITVDIYPSGSWAGTAVNFGSSGFSNAGWYVASMPTASQGALTYSSRVNPSSPTTANMQPNTPTGSPGTLKGIFTNVSGTGTSPTPAVVVRRTYTYEA